MHLCPSCLSVEGLSYCPHCGMNLDAPQEPLFWCTLGWSRSRDYESILRDFRVQAGYRCVETAEEVLHQVPLVDIARTEALIRRFPRAMQWKETRLETALGIPFPLHSPTGACFLRRVLENIAPCLQDPPSCPFLGGLRFPEGGLAGTLQLAAFLASRRDVLLCPYARILVQRSFDEICPGPEQPFAAAMGRRALEEGRIVMTLQGHSTQRKAGGAPWPAVSCPDIPREASWAACSGRLQVAVVDDVLRVYPGGRRIAQWLSASLAAPTADGRHVAIPTQGAPDPVFLLFCEDGDDVMPCGPFPLPFALDSHVRQVAFALQEPASEGVAVVLARFVGDVATPFWLQTGAWQLPQHARQLVCEQGRVGALAESGHVWRLSAGGQSDGRVFPECVQIAFFDRDTMAVLWKGGSRLTFWHDRGMQDFSLLIPAVRIVPARGGHLVLVSQNRITEMSSDGAVVDFRSGEALWMSSRGYMERTTDGYVWHVMEDAPVHGDFWKTPPPGHFLVAPRDNVALDESAPDFSLISELISYFITAGRESGLLYRLVSQAPPRVRKELRETLRRHPWLERFDAAPEDWPLQMRELEEIHLS